MLEQALIFLFLLPDAKLLRPVDVYKDQTFFLASISQESLRRTMFPLATVTKPQAKRIVTEIGLEYLSEKKEVCSVIFLLALFSVMNGRLFSEYGSVFYRQT